MCQKYLNIWRNGDLDCHNWRVVIFLFQRINNKYHSYCNILYQLIKFELEFWLSIMGCYVQREVHSKFDVAQFSMCTQVWACWLVIPHKGFEIGFSQPPFVFPQFQIALILLFPIFVLSNGLIKEAGNKQKLYIRHAMIWPIIKLKFKEVDWWRWWINGIYYSPLDLNLHSFHWKYLHNQYATFSFWCANSFSYKYN
jgi:hypothetical protein